MLDCEGDEERESAVVGEKCVKDDYGNLTFDDEAKKLAWKLERTLRTAPFQESNGMIEP